MSGWEEFACWGSGIAFGMLFYHMGLVMREGVGAVRETIAMAREYNARPRTTPDGETAPATPSEPTPASGGAA